MPIRNEAASRVPRLYGVRRNLEKNPFNQNTAEVRTLGIAPCCQFLRLHSFQLQDQPSSASDDSGANDIDVTTHIDIGWISADGSEQYHIGFIRDETLGQTYSVVRHEADSRIVRRWIPPYSPMVDIIPRDIVISQLSFPVAVIGTIPLDHRLPEPNMLARRFDSADDRIFAYDAELQQWRHIPDWATFQAMGFYWCNVTAADAGFFERITIGSPFPASGTPERDDHPNCQS